jgi:hypothetical protein
LVPDSAIRLFDSGERTRIAVRRHNEGSYAFLNSCAWPSIARVRAYWEAWFTEYDGDRKDLASRFRSPMKHPHLSAFLELFTFACLKRANCEVRVAPKLAQYSLDFLASNRNSGLSFYAECTATGTSREESAADLRKAEVHNAIDQIPTGCLMVGINVAASGASNVSLKALRPEYARWIASLSREPVNDQETRWVWERDGWRLEFWATPVDGEGGLGMIGPDIFDAGEQPIRLREAIDAKASKYGPLDSPLLIVANSIEHQGERELSLAVAGDRYYQINLATREGSILRKANGVFVNTYGARNTSMSAVMHGYFGPLSFASNPVIRLVHHPYTSRPLPRGLFPFCEEWHFDAEGDRIVVAPSTSLMEFLGLPAEWPYFDQDPE